MSKIANLCTASFEDLEEAKIIRTSLGANVGRFSMGSIKLDGEFTLKELSRLTVYVAWAMGVDAAGG